MEKSKICSEVFENILKIIDENTNAMLEDLQKTISENIRDSSANNKAKDYFFNKINKGIQKSKQKFAVIWNKMTVVGRENFENENEKSVDLDLLKKFIENLLSLNKEKEKKIQNQEKSEYLSATLESLKKYDYEIFENKVASIFTRYDEFLNKF